MRLNRKTLRPLLTIFGALVGAVLGSATQTVLNGRLRLISAAVVVLCLLTIALLSAVSIYADRATATHEGVLRAASELATDIELRVETVVNLIEVQNTTVAERLGSLSRQFGMQVGFQLLAELNELRSVDADLVSQLMVSAEREILVIDLLSPTGVWPDQVMQVGHMRSHFDRIIEFVKGSNTHVGYRRILQVDDLRAPFAHAKSEVMLDHLQKMFLLRTEDRHRVSVKVARKQFPYKFIIIDRRSIVLQLQQYDEIGENLIIWGEIVFTHASDELLKIFLEVWHDIEDDMGTRPVTWDELVGTQDGHTGENAK